MSIIFLGGHVDTISKSTSGRRRRRTFNPAFKAELVAACQHPGVSVAAVALDHGLNANLLRRWVTEHERYGYHSGEEGVISLKQPLTPALRSSAAPTPPAPFVPVNVAPAPTHSEIISLDIRRGAATMRVEWPMSGAAQCAELLREWLR